MFDAGQNRAVLTNEISSLSSSCSSSNRSSRRSSCHAHQLKVTWNTSCTSNDVPTRVGAGSSWVSKRLPYLGNIRCEPGTLTWYSYSPCRHGSQWRWLHVASACQTQPATRSTPTAEQSQVPGDVTVFKPSVIQPRLLYRNFYSKAHMYCDSIKFCESGRVQRSWRWGRRDVQMSPKNRYGKQRRQLKAFVKAGSCCSSV